MHEHHQPRERDSIKAVDSQTYAQGQLARAEAIPQPNVIPLTESELIILNSIID
jgi:hypothetical protein